MDHDESLEHLKTTCVRSVSATDIEPLYAILETAVKNPITGEVFHDEIAEILDSVIDSINGDNNKKYFVSTDENEKVTGIMGYQPVSEPMQKYATSDNCAEINNAYVDQTSRRTGAGSNLAQAVMDSAKQAGFDQIVVNSGPRYMLTGWKFWTKQFGERVAMAPDYYGPGFDASVWRKDLTS